jgi:hypothetical protein
LKASSESNPVMSDPTTISPAGNYFGDASSAGPANQGSRGLVPQVSIVAVLMIVQGLLELIMALCFGGAAIFMLSFTEQIAPQAGNPKMVAGMLGAMAAVVLVCGLLRIVAAIPLYQQRGRKLAVISMLVGLLVVSSGYCVPTATALAVYGLIVLFDERVIEACDTNSA